MPENATDSAVVLSSGGIESAMLLSGALERCESVTPVYIRNYLRWEDAELFWLKQFLRTQKSPRLKPLKIFELPMRDLYENHWSITGVKVPGAKSKDMSVYLPGRNLILISKAACLAAMNDISAIEIGVLKGNPFSDSTPAFFKKFSDVLSLGLSKPIQIKAPFHKMKKDEIMVRGKNLPLELTFSCIDPKGYDHCGDCNKCIERKRAFFAAGIFDKTHYKKSGL